MSRENTAILSDILTIEKDNLFLRYIVDRLKDDKYRGWHVSQHNRYDMYDIEKILQAIFDTVGKNYFAIPPGDYKQDCVLPNEYHSYREILSKIKSDMGRGTINSLKKNFFPDIKRMGFLVRNKIHLNGTSKQVWHGKLTPEAIEFIQAKKIIDKYKKFSDAIEKLFRGKISELAEIIDLSDYNTERFSIYEFMFIFSDEEANLDKIELLASYRALSKYQQNKTTELIQKYANPKNFMGNKTVKRDFHNWKNEAQQIFRLLGTTVYFNVDKNTCFGLNMTNTGFYSKPPSRSPTSKLQYFKSHQIEKRDGFELHHIVPIKFARNKKEAKSIDDYRNLIYIQRDKHREISQSGNKKVVLDISPDKSRFSDFDRVDIVEAENGKNTFYSRDTDKVRKMANYNIKLLKEIFDFDPKIAN